MNSYLQMIWDTACCIGLDNLFGTRFGELFQVYFNLPGGVLYAPIQSSVVSRENAVQLLLSLMPLESKDLSNPIPLRDVANRKK